MSLDSGYVDNLRNQLDAMRRLLKLAYEFDDYTTWQKFMRWTRETKELLDATEEVA